MTRAPRSRPGAGEPTADVLAAEWALGVLEPAEREAAEARAAADPDFAAAAAAWSERLSALAEEAPAVEPTADLWPRIAAALGDPTVAPAAIARERAAGRRRGGGRARAAPAHGALAPARRGGDGAGRGQCGAGRVRGEPPPAGAAAAAQRQAGSRRAPR